jgi:uncharacterized membrane protein
MRQLRLTVPAGAAGRTDALLDRHGADAVRRWDLDDGARCVELLLTNGAVGGFLDEVADLGDVTITMAPQSVLGLAPGRDAAPEDLVDVEALSAQEVFLGGLQSVGSWTGFLGYAGVAGSVVWIGMLLDSVFLLIAAMLIAPFAGPAMNAALATAAGDGRLLRRSVVRYGAAIAVVVAVVAALHALLGTDIPTRMMDDTANVASVAVLLPLVAGAAGALNLMQAERSSLVSGAATGVLVAAALAPPAGLVGMSLVMGEWEMAGSGAFLLALQLAGLNLSGAVVFRIYGVRPEAARYGRGTATVTWVALAASVVVLGALVGFQLSSAPTLQRSSVQTDVAGAITSLVDDDPEADLVEVDARFTRADISDQDTLLAVVHVQPAIGADPVAVEERLGPELSRAISEGYDVVALVTVTAIPRP